MQLQSRQTQETDAGATHRLVHSGPADNAMPERMTILHLHQLSERRGLGQQASAGDKDPCGKAHGSRHPDHGAGEDC